MVKNKVCSKYDKTRVLGQSEHMQKKALHWNIQCHVRCGLLIFEGDPLIETIILYNNSLLICDISGQLFETTLAIIYRKFELNQ